MEKTLKIAINGFGRIGRCVMRAIYEQSLPIKIVAINEPADIDSIKYLIQFDSTQGRFPGSVDIKKDKLIVSNDEIKVFQTQNISDIPWQKLDIDLLLECSGKYTEKTELQKFIAAGCPKLLLSNPAKNAEEIDQTIVFGINEQTISANDKIISAASCTTNAVVPVLNLLQEKFGVAGAFMTSLHSVMNDQPLIDGYHNQDLRRTRSALQSMVPVKTGLAQGIERILPELKGLTQAKSVRVPIVNVSAIDLSVNVKADTNESEVIELFKTASQQQNKLIACEKQAYASIDFNQDPQSSIIDISQIRVNQNRFINLLVWFDNEWGFANRMLDLAQYWAKKF